MDRHEAPAPDVGQRAQRLLGRCVARLHDHGRQVGADGNRGHVEGAEPRADLREPAKVGRVPREVEALGAAGDGPAAPEPAVPIPQGAAREMVGRDAGQREPGDGAALPPVQLPDLGDAELGEPRAEPERDQEARPMGLGEPLDGRHVEMVVVVVRDEDDVDWRQVLEREAGRGHALGTGEPDGARAIRPLRIGQNVHPVQLDQQRRVADPGHRVGGGIPPDRLEVAPDDGKVRGPRMEGRRPDARDEEAPAHPGGRGRGHGIDVGEPSFPVMGGRARNGLADTVAGTQTEGEKEEGYTRPDQRLSSPTGSSRRNDAPPSGRFSAQSRPPSSVTIP